MKKRLYRAEAAARASLSAAIEPLEGRLLLSASPYNISTVASFPANNRLTPTSGLVSEVISGTLCLFGTTTSTVFEIVGTSKTPVVLATFNGTNGSNPVGGLSIDGQGDIFGTTLQGGGANGDGTVFEIARTTAGFGPLNTLATFSLPANTLTNINTNGCQPSGSLAIDANGDLFGTASSGGANGDGTIFEIAKTTAGFSALNTLASFDGTNGSQPLSGLLIDSSGNLYGTTETGGTFGDGTVFELPDFSSTIATLVDFNGTTNGATPGYGTLVMDASGNIYGTTEVGGADGDGTVFELATNGTAGVGSQNTGNTAGVRQASTGGTLALVFVQDPTNTNAGSPFAPTVQVAIETNSGVGNDIDVTDNADITLTLNGGTGSLSGQTTEQAINGVATFTNVSVNTAGNYTLTATDATDDLTANSLPFTVNGVATTFSFSTLVSLTGTNGRSPYGNLILDASGDIYGTTFGGGTHKSGTAFEIVSGSKTITTLDSLTAQGDPRAGLVVDASGNLYGITSSGGARGGGTIFQLSPSGKLAFDVQPATNVTGAAETVVVDINSKANALITTNTASNSIVTLSIQSGPKGAVLNGTLSVQAIDGIATFTGISLSESGHYTLRASDGNITRAISAGFAMSPQLAFAQVPTTTNDTPPLEVDFVGVSGIGSPIGNDRGSIHLSVVSGPGDLTGKTTVQAINGVAEFSDLSFNAAGTYTLRASSGGLAPITDTFVVSVLGEPMIPAPE
jgi:uncharacterized repeat protein (TIGR03803 family)